MNKNSNRVEAVERALSILEIFKKSKKPLTLAEIAKETGLYKSTILRLIGSLELFGYIYKTTSGAYKLGVSLYQLGLAYKQSFDIEDCIRPALETLVEKTNETAAYYIRIGDQRLCLYRVNSPMSARHHLEEGALLPLNVGATGHILLAYESETEKSLIIREQGYYISLGERNPDVAAVAVPVLSKDGSIYGSLSVSGLMSRYDNNRQKLALKLLQDSSKEIANKLDNDNYSYFK